MLFSDYFKVDKKVINEYGAIDISLICDTPLFIDPILIYSNSDMKIKNCYAEIVKYLLFLNSIAQKGLDDRSVKYYFTFKERRQNWLGLAKNGNKGLALGIDFANELASKIGNICNTKNLSDSIHIEKMFLLNRGVGRDKISDMVTNILFYFFIKYTEEFAIQHIGKEFCSNISIPHAKFNYETKIFEDVDAYLPYYVDEKGRKEFVILTPSSILRKEEQEINYEKMKSSFENVKNSISNEDLRFQIDAIIQDTLNQLYSRKRQSSSTVTIGEINRAKEEGLEKSLNKFPELYDYFIKLEEENASNVFDTANEEVLDVKSKLIENKLINVDVLDWATTCEFITAKEESLYRINYLKNQIENCGLWKNLYYKGERISQESELQRLFHLVWARTKYMFSSEVNDGAGPVDFKVSFGKINSCLIEFKLASNSRLKNVFKQVNEYKKSSGINEVIVVVFYFDDKEKEKARLISLDGQNLGIDVITIDCDYSNKESASKK